MTPTPNRPEARDELKTCPFCGSSAKRFEVRRGEYIGGHGIKCTNCGCSTDLTFACGDEPWPLVIEKWNRRPGHPPSAHAGLIAEAREWHPSIGEGNTFDLILRLVNALEAAPAAQGQTIGGIRLVADPTIPEGEAELRSGNQKVRITNLAPPAPTFTPEQMITIRVIERINRLIQGRHDDETFTADVKYMRSIVLELSGVADA